MRLRVFPCYVALVQDPHACNAALNPLGPCSDLVARAANHTHPSVMQDTSNANANVTLCQEQLRFCWVFACEEPMPTSAIYVPSQQRMRALYEHQAHAEGTALHSWQGHLHHQHA